MGRPRIGKHAMTAAERQRRRRELQQLGITHSFLAGDERAWKALDVIDVHLDSLETANFTHDLVRQVWVKQLLALLKRMRELLEREAAKLKAARR
jgi:hypothetical protein